MDDAPIPCETKCLESIQLLASRSYGRKASWSGKDLQSSMVKIPAKLPEGMDPTIYSAKVPKCAFSIEALRSRTLATGSHY